MKINKKLLVVMLTLVVGSMTLAGCGQKKENLPTPPVATVEPEATTQPTEIVEPEITAPPTETPVIEMDIDEVTGEAIGEVDPTLAQETLYVVTNGIEMPEGVSMDAKMFMDTYGIDTNLLSSYYVQMPMKDVHATEVAVFELKDAKDVDKVIGGIEKRQKALLEQWKDYLADQARLVENYKMAQKGNMVIFVISTDAAQIIKQFEAM